MILQFFVIGFATLLVLAAGARAGEPLRITVGTDTTRATEPLRDDGTVNYVAALNERMSKGVTPDNNAAVALLGAMGPVAFGMTAKAEGAEALKRVWPMLGTGPMPETGNYYVAADAEVAAELDAVGLKPWKAAEHPLAAKWLTSQDDAIDSIAQATRQPRLYLPIVSKGEPQTVFAQVPYGLTAIREAANALARRAFFRLGDGDFEGFRADMQAVRRLARLLAQRPIFIDQLVAGGIEALGLTAIREAATGEHLTAAQTKLLLADLDALPPMPSMKDAVDLGERYVMLDLVGLASVHGWRKAAGMLAGSGNKPMILSGKQNRDWDALLRKTNERYDRLIKVIELPTFAERRKKGDELDREHEELHARAHGALGLILRPEDHFYALLGPSLFGTVGHPQKLVSERELARVALALAVHKADRDAYPKTLDALTPAYLPKLPIDEYAEQGNGPGGTSFLFELNDVGGYRLASVGYDGKDERIVAERHWKGRDAVVTGGPQPPPPAPEPAPDENGGEGVLEADPL